MAGKLKLASMSRRKAEARSLKTQHPQGMMTPTTNWLSLFNFEGWFLCDGDVEIGISLRPVGENWWIEEKFSSGQCFFTVWNVDSWIVVADTRVNSPLESSELSVIYRIYCIWPAAILKSSPCSSSYRLANHFAHDRITFFHCVLGIDRTCAKKWVRNRRFQKRYGRSKTWFNFVKSYKKIFWSGDRRIVDRTDSPAWTFWEYGLLTIQVEMTTRRSAVRLSPNVWCQRQTIGINNSRSPSPSAHHSQKTQISEYPDQYRCPSLRTGDRPRRIGVNTGLISLINDLKSPPFAGNLASRWMSYGFPP
jgi:hypothetical protein